MSEANPYLLITFYKPFIKEIIIMHYATEAEKGLSLTTKVTVAFDVTLPSIKETMEICEEYHRVKQKGGDDLEGASILTKAVGILSEKLGSIPAESIGFQATRNVAGIVLLAQKIVRDTLSSLSDDKLTEIHVTDSVEPGAHKGIVLTLESGRCILYVTRYDALGKMVDVSKSFASMTECNVFCEGGYRHLAMHISAGNPSRPAVVILGKEGVTAPYFMEREH